MAIGVSKKNLISLRIRDELSDWNLAVEGNVALLGLGLAPLGVGAVDVVQQSHGAEILVELEVVVVVELGRLDQRQVVARVRVDGVENGVGEPKPRRHRVRTENTRPQDHREHVGENVLDGVRVHGHDGDRRRPLVVLLVHVLVHKLVVQHPEKSSKYSKLAFYLLMRTF